jgi:hypothetical protein
MPVLVLGPVVATEAGSLLSFFWGLARGLGGLEIKTALSIQRIWHFLLLVKLSPSRMLMV